jgi:aminoglycoside phosphotransferase (APT) family kinase protein
VPSTIGLGPSGRADGGGAASAPARGEQIDRFVVLETLGHGGMGVVVSAYDPKLDRKVALKLLRRDLAPTDGGTEARARLLREAQAMAKLRHPNVVTVFEVGEYRGQVFLAMEHVAGGTLIAWSALRRAEPRGWLRTVAAFVQAGRGLQAAHARELIHRDFKPANVLVEDDRFQVSDFGIASVGGQAPPEFPLPAGADPTAGEPTLTRSGHVVGTAPYMALELIDGEPADERSDQFAFCVALFESLYGVRPFDGETVEQVRAAQAEGRIREVPQDLGVPEWVRLAVVRGLARDPQARWPSMGALLETLASPDEADAERRTRVVVAVAIGLLFAALPLAARWWGPPFDRSNYAGAVGQTLALVAILLALTFVSRRAVWATALNRRAFGAVLAVLLMQLPLQLANAALGVSVVASDIQLLTLWAAMAAMFAVTADRRFFALSACYLLWIPLAVRFPDHTVTVLGFSNVCLVVFVSLVWRGAKPREV